MEKNEILEKIDRQYGSLREFISTKADQAPKQGEWGMKDLLAHIAAWENVLLHFHIGGKPFEDVIEMPGARYHETSFDDINAHLFSKYESWSMEDVEQFADETHEAMMEKLASLEDHQYQEPAEPILAIGLEPHPLYEYVAANTFDHYSEHLEDFEATYSD